MRRSPCRWRTPFGRFVETVGVTRLALELGAAGQPVTPKAVYNWLAGDRVPRPERATEMVRLSGGTITLEHVYEHRALAREVRRG